MNFPNLGPPCCMPRPKMMRISWTSRGRLQYILDKGLFEKEESEMINKNEKKNQR